MEGQGAEEALSQERALTASPWGWEAAFGLPELSQLINPRKGHTNKDQTSDCIPQPRCNAVQRSRAASCCCPVVGLAQARQTQASHVTRAWCVTWGTMPRPPACL